MHVCDRDISQLLPQSALAIESSGQFSLAIANLSKSFRSSSNAFSALALVESGFDSEHRSWKVMEKCGDRISPILQAVSMHLQTGDVGLR